MSITRINITVTAETLAQADDLLRDQITPNFSGLIRRLIDEAHAKSFPLSHDPDGSKGAKLHKTKYLRQRKISPK